MKLKVRKMDARGKTIYACLTVLIFVAWFVASTLVMNFSKQVPGSSAMVFCVVVYLIEGNSVNSLLRISGDCQMPDSFLEKHLRKST